MVPERWLAPGLFSLAVLVAAASVLGPLALESIEYHVSEEMLNQVIGADAVSLVIVAPLATLAGLLALRGHRAAPALALGVGAYVAYIYAQLAVGGEFLEYPGNSGNYFALLLALVTLGGAIAVRAWSLLDIDSLPVASARTRRIAGVLMLAVAAFLLFGLHLPGLLDAWSGDPTSSEYLDNPSVFWTVKLMDLGIIVPAAVAAGAGVLRGASAARKVMYAIVTWFALLGAAVAAMGIVMLVNDDPAASVAQTAGFTGFAIAFWLVAGWLFRPLFVRPR